MSATVLPLPGLADRLAALSAALHILRFAREFTEDAKRTGDRMTTLRAYRVSAAATAALWPLCAATALGRKPPPGPVRVLERHVLYLWVDALGLCYDLRRCLWRAYGRIQRAHLDRMRRRSLGAWRPSNDTRLVAA